MLNKKLMAVLVLLAVAFSVPSWGAQFRKRISDSQFIDMCKEGNTQGVIEAIKSGANVNAKDNGDYTALMWAAGKGHTETVNALIKAGADDLTDNDGKTALIRATEYTYSNPETVNALIEAGSYVKHRDKDGKRALNYARKNDNLEDSDALKRLEELSR